MTTYYDPENNTPRMWSRNQLIELLTEVLRVDLDTVQDYGYGGDTVTSQVAKLYIDGEVQ